MRFSRRETLRMGSGSVGLLILTACAGGPSTSAAKATAAPSTRAAAVQTRAAVTPTEASAPAATSGTAATMPAGSKPDWVTGHYFDPPKASDYPHDDMSKHYQITFMFASAYGGPPMYGPDKDYKRAYFEKKMNIDLKPVNPKNLYQQLQLQTAAGEIPDIVKGLTTAQCVEMAKQGVAVPDVMPLIKTYMPNYLKMMGGEGSKLLQPARQADGTYPSVWSPHFGLLTGGDLFFYRKDWLAKLKLAVPKTLDDVLQVATTFMNEDPDGDGKKDTYGFLTIIPNKNLSPFGRMDSISGLFGAPGGLFQPSDYFLHDKLLSCGYWLSGRRDFIAWFQKAAALMPKNWYTLGPSTFYDRSGKDDFGFLHYNTWTFWTGKTPRDPSMVDKYGWIASVEGPAGRRMEMTNPGGPNFTVTAQLTQDEGKLARALHMMDEWCIYSSDMAKVASPFDGWHVNDFPKNNLVDVKIGPWTVEITNSDRATALNTKLGIRPGIAEWALIPMGRTSGQEIMKDKELVITEAHRFREQDSELPREAALAQRPKYDPALITPDAEITAALLKDRVQNETEFVFGKRPLSEWDSYVQGQLDQIGGRKILDAGLKELQAKGYDVAGVDPRIPGF